MQNRLIEYLPMNQFYSNESLERFNVTKCLPGAATAKVRKSNLKITISGLAELPRHPKQFEV